MCIDSHVEPRMGRWLNLRSEILITVLELKLKLTANPPLTILHFTIRPSVHHFILQEVRSSVNFTRVRNQEGPESFLTARES